MSYAHVNGLDIYYEVHGSGEPLVLLHGGLLTIDLTFAAVLPALARTRRVIAVELQGHGHTADTERPFELSHLAGDVVGLLDELGIEKADFFGFSLGGLVSLQVAMAYPERAGRLVVAGVHFRADGYHPEVFALDPHSKRLPTEADFAAMRDAYLAVAPVPEHFEVFMAKASALPEKLDWSADDLGAVASPVLIVVGDTDFVRVDHAAEMRQHIPDSRLAVLPGTTHMDLTRRADLVLPLVEPFLDETPTRD
ncbi:MAG: alpha/beta fold hydrolase [Actinophytocola sp.]|uniref:alpha/beta fold hydrolase n=1 Tax=Actinophytocola sp. TaxID=1872138 RepID=UPI0013248DD5|nr:alpha/beta hydrolase [Actinophytocola sp.]MPZ82046.1 alpha/beta fold hydrolase [Actinophytocola sp.]